MSSDGNMAAKTELGEGRHNTSVTFGQVYSDHETDGAGRGPDHFARHKAENTSSVPVRDEPSPVTGTPE